MGGRRGWLTGLAATLAPLAVGALLAVGWQAMGPPKQPMRFLPRAAAHYGSRTTAADTSQTSSRNVTADPGQPAVPLLRASGRRAHRPPELAKHAKDGLARANGHKDPAPGRGIVLRHQPAGQRHARGHGKREHPAPQKTAPQKTAHKHPAVPEKKKHKNPERIVVTVSPAPSGTQG
jgi:hypothetical protein